MIKFLQNGCSLWPTVSRTALKSCCKKKQGPRGPKGDTGARGATGATGSSGSRGIASVTQLPPFSETVGIPADTDFPFSTVRYIDNALYEAVTNGIQVKQAGFYRVTVAVSGVVLNFVGLAVLGLAFDGAGVAPSLRAASSDQRQLVFDQIIHVDANTAITARNNGSATVTVVSNADQTYGSFIIELVSLD